MARREVVHAPELTGRAWLNTDEPLSLAALRGKVVLLDFWTFCCINCLHVLEELRELEERFAAELVVIGVHSPKFPHEQDAAALRRAIARHGVTHPVLDDPDMTTWRRYGVRAWPTLVLIDPRGYIVGARTGEGVKEALAAAIDEVIADAETTLALARGPLPSLRPPPAPSGPLAFPGRVARDPETGRLAVADTGHHRIVVLDPGGTVVAVAGRGDRGLADGDFAHACFADPQGMLFRDGEILVADSANHAIRRLDVAQGTVSTVAGTGQQGRGRGGSGPARTTPLNSPWDLAPFADVVAVAMAGSHQIWYFDPHGDEVGVLAGDGREALIDGPARAAAMAQPSGIAEGADGRLWVVDSEASALRVLSRREDHLELATVVGTGLFAWGADDGPAAEATFQHPLDVETLPDGRVLVCDSYNSLLRVYDPSSRQVSTLAVEPGVLDEPSGIVAMPEGRVLVCDSNHHRLVLVGLDMGAVQTFAAHGLEPPEYEVAVAELDEVAVAPQGTLRLVLAPRLPRGEKLDRSGGSPLRIAIEHGSEAEGAGPRLTLDVPAPPSGGELLIDLAVASCGEGQGAVCRLRRGRLAVPVRIDHAAPRSVEVHLD